MTLFRVTLLSDACFAGSSLTFAADADTCQELDHLGLPVIGGRALRGLLVEEVAILIRGLGERAGPWREAAARTFGVAGAARSGALTLSDARYPEQARRALEAALQTSPELANLAARATTALRRQTRIDPVTGAAAENTLHATRLARSGLSLEAIIQYHENSLALMPEMDRALVAGAALMLRRGGLHRSRGWGRLRCEVVEDGTVMSGWAEPLLEELSR